jgi:hypothetical protein
VKRPPFSGSRASPRVQRAAGFGSLVFLRYAQRPFERDVDVGKLNYDWRTVLPPNGPVLSMVVQDRGR